MLEWLIQVKEIVTYMYHFIIKDTTEKLLTEMPRAWRKGHGSPIPFLGTLSLKHLPVFNSSDFCGYISLESYKGFIYVDSVG